MKTIKFLAILVICGSMAKVSVAQQEQAVKVKAGLGFPVSQTEPEFPGGMDALKDFVHENLVYPQHLIDSRVGGRVVIIFIVDKEGKIVDPTVMKGVNEELNAEALRIVKMMPNWTPGTNGGNPVNKQFILPIDFQVPTTSI